MPNDPTDLNDPTHPFHAMGTGFAEMRQRRLEHDARQRMMVQMLAAAGPAGPLSGGSGGFGPMQAPAGAASAMGGMGGGLTGLAQAMAGQPQQINSAKFGPGPDTSNQWFAKDGGMKAPDALPASSVPLGGMAKG